MSWSVFFPLTCLLLIVPGGHAYFMTPGLRKSITRGRPRSLLLYSSLRKSFVCHRSQTQLAATVMVDNMRDPSSGDLEDDSFLSAITPADAVIPDLINPTNGVLSKNALRSTRPIHQKPRKSQNTAMSDPVFLRKRTINLLKLTERDDVVAADVVPALNGKLKVDRKTFHFLLDAWAFSGEADAPEQASKLLRRMEELDERKVHGIQPDVRSYTKVINAYSRSSSGSVGGGGGGSDVSLTAGERAEQILAHMWDLYQTGRNPTAKPNLFTHTAVLEAHANGAAGVLGSSAARAQKLCTDMVHEYLKVATNNGKKARGMEEDMPTARAFNAVLLARTKSLAPESAQLAESWLDRMQSWYDEFPGLLTSSKPQGFHYNMLISAWANSGQDGSADCAERILGRMERQYLAGDVDVKPTAISYNSVIDAYAKSGQDNAADKAEEILRHMEYLYESGENVEAKPNVRSFNSALNAWAKSRQHDAARKAQDMLDLMEQLYQHGNLEVRPDVHSFCTVINAWARSPNSKKAERAFNLFREMKALYYAGNQQVRPNVVAVNAVLNACAYSSNNLPEQNRSVEIAHAILRELEAFGKPDQVTYGTFLKVFANQMSDCSTREQVVDVVFRKCCRDGYLGMFVLQQLHSMTSESYYKALLGLAADFDASDVALDTLPGEWSRNVITCDKWQQKQRRY